MTFSPSSSATSYSLTSNNGTIMKSKREKKMEEIRGQNEKAMLQEALDKAGLDIKVTGKVEWKPGEPVENNAHMMLLDDFMENAPAEEVKKHYPYMFRATDGVMRDMRFTAPELFPKDDEKGDSNEGH